ncbi:MAG: trehalase family glycosidase [Ginsengibacter sp.]
MNLIKNCGVTIFLLASGTVHAQRNQYPNILKLQAYVTNVKNIEPSVFSDLGAWHAYALPQRKEDYGGFAGPLLMDMDGRWLANNFSQLHIYENGKEIKLSNAKAALSYYPGILEQDLQIGDLDINLKLIFVSDREALIQTKIINKGNRKRQIAILYKGDALLPVKNILSKDNGIEVTFPKNDYHFMINYFSEKALDIKINTNNYSATLKNINILPGKDFELSQVQSFYPDSAEITPEITDYVFSKELKKNETRWNGYLQKYFSHSPALDLGKRKLGVKSIITLVTNWRSAAKDILHDGVFPSVNYQGFYGVWSWDSWKQAVALSFFNPELAENNIRCMFDYQDEYGMVADCIYTDKKENNWRDTKPPLSAWAVWNVYQNSKDISFVKEMYPKLVKYHQWWYQNRDHDDNKLCEYGSTDGTRIAAAWESGMDNAVRFDSAVIIKNNGHAWSLNQESVDLNSYLYAEKIFLQKLAEILGKIDDAIQWKNEAATLKELINKQFFDTKKGYYFDKLFAHEGLIRIEGPEGWIPLWAGVSNDRQASSVEKIMANKNKFNTRVPLPTLAADNPQFNPQNGYWRGPVWLDQFYFGIEGLNRYGYTKLANEMLNQLWKNAEGMQTDIPIFENYHPVTGKGLNAKNFSWSAAHILMMLKTK